MDHFKSLKAGEISLIASENHSRLVVLVESAEEPQVYETDSDDKSAADIFDNLYHKWNDTLEGDGVNVAVFSYDNAFVREMSAEQVLERIQKNVAALAKEMEIAPDDVGVIICSTEIGNKCFKNGLDWLNVLIANQSDKRPTKAFPLRLPFDSGFAWTLSIPTWLWTRSGSIKDDGAGVNLIGYVVRAAAVVLYRQTEGSIYKQMRAYHRGKYGELKIVYTLDDFEEMFKDISRKKYVSIDTEATSLNRVNENKLLAIQFTTVDKRTDIPKMWVLPWRHREFTWQRQALKYITKKLRGWLEKAEKQVHVYHTYKYDFHQFLRELKVRFYAARVYDVTAGNFSLEENAKFLKPMKVSGHGLERMERSMEYERPPELVIKKADRGNMEKFSIQEIADYGVIDVLTPLYIMFEQLEIAKTRGYPNFFTFITRQMGVMLKAMTEMEHNGIAVDMEYLKNIASPIGPLAERIRATAAKLAEMPNAVKANKTLLDRSSFQKNGLFGKAQEPQLWNIRDKKHLRLLFFDILGLQPLGFGKDEEGKLDKKFKKVYRHTPEVKIFSDYEKLVKLKSAFANAIYKYMTEHPDMRHDKRLRPFFAFLGVLTGRSSTTSPSTQQIPQHGPDAKLIKRQFKVGKRKIILKSDYSAHEVRVSGNLSGDPAICDVVDIINKGLHAFRIAGAPEEVLEAIKNLGDIHVLNYYTFYEVRIDKKDPRRQDAKTAIFAVTYGSLEKSIAESMLSTALYALEDKLVATPNPDKGEKPLTDKERRTIEKQVRYLKSEAGWEEYLAKSYDLLATLKEKWGILTKFINKEQKKAQKYNVVFGPHGRPRHLWGYLHYDKFIGFAMNRRVFNSEGQGYASDYGFTGIYLAKKAKWDLFDSKGLTVDSKQTNAVHDSSFNELEFKFLPLMAYLQEHAMVSKTKEYYKKYFGIESTTDYGFEFEVGISEDKMETWNGRADMPEGMASGEKDPKSLVELIKYFGPQVGYSEDEIKHVIHDAKLLGKLRLEELHSKNPNKMTLEEDHIYSRIVPRLRCFQSQYWEEPKEVEDDRPKVRNKRRTLESA
ncbi:DNA polymerase I protein [Rhizobium phage RHph_N28_1]|nr:DNA polymerase I protein [Rhizobium phage RHph_N28_1]QIG74278.1 DNA polymerase I protein [Rhizobium phage RHph_N42]